MQHKLLMGSTALVSAGLLLPGSALAQETRVGGIEIVLGGYTEFGISAANRDTLDDVPNRNYAFFMDNVVAINADGATASGIVYGSHLEIEVGSGLGYTNDVTVDEVGLHFSGNFGRIELGQEDGAEEVMGIGGADAQAGTGGIDGDTTNLTQFETIDTGNATKATYFTPRVAGFQLGVSWVPDDGDGVNDRDGGQENIIGAGGNWVGALGALDLTVAATGILGEHEPGGGADSTNDDLRSWDAGVLFGFDDFTVGVGGGQNIDLDEANYINAGLEYGFGAANASVGYNFFDPDQGDSSNLFVVSGDVGLLPGVTLKGDVSYNTDDPGAHLDEDDPDDTIAGIVTVQLDY